jgi:hypothetical protein
MGLVNPTQSAPGETIEADDINTPVNQLAAVINGSIETANIADSAVTTAKIADSNVTTAKLADSNVTYAKVAAGFPVQMVNTTSSAVATGTTTIPNDDTIPQITEGTEFLTLAITPKATTHILVIDVTIMLSYSVAAGVIGAIFQDATANALAAGAVRNTAGGETNILQLRHIMTAGTTSSTTFRVRAGGDGAGTITFNGDSGARKLGSTIKSSIVITEYKA